VAYIFEPCDQFKRDPELPQTNDRLERSCVYCIHQYQPGHVCRVFQKRLLRAAGLERGEGEAQRLVQQACARSMER